MDTLINEVEISKDKETNKDLVNKDLVNKVTIINDIIKMDLKDDEVENVSDGYHTFNELYSHRILLFLLVMKLLAKQEGEGVVWWSENHHDGPSYSGWLICGIYKEEGKQITYHIPSSYKEFLLKCENIEHLDKAPEFDGHSSDDVLDRLENLIYN